MNHEWIKTTDELPPEKVVVATKYDFGRGARNERRLMMIGVGWFYPGGSIVYYVPTHWKRLEEKI